MVRTVVTCVTYMVAVSIKLIRVPAIGAVVKIAFNFIFIRIYKRGFTDIALLSFRLAVMLVSVGVSRAVVTCIADSVTVSI